MRKKGTKKPTKMNYTTHRTAMTADELESYYKNVRTSAKVYKDKSKFDRKNSRRQNKVRF